MHNQIDSFRVALDARPVSSYQWWILLLLTLLMVTDGYDAHVLAYVVPVLAQEWGVEKAAFGPVFSANLLGLTVGALAITPLADRFGVRRILLASVVIYATLTALTVFVNSLSSLMVARFICGIGMGGAMPCAMALMSEYSPPRLRTMMVTMAACGFSFGGAAGGFVAAGFISSFGWRSVFIAGALAPVLLLPFLLKYLPESLPRLLRDQPPYIRLRKITARLVPGWQPPVASVAQNEPEQGSRLTVIELFRHGYARPTLLIWSTFFVSLILVYFMISWLPSLLLESGMKLSEANLVTSVFLFAGTFGAVCLAWLADRLQHKVRLFSAVFVSGAVCTIMLGLHHENPRYLWGLAFVAGFFIIGGQLALNAFTNNFYPSHVRATGAGWALGIGRFGSILGPLFGAMLLAMHIPVPQIFFYCAIPAVIAAWLVIQVRLPAPVPSADSERSDGANVTLDLSASTAKAP